MGVYIFQIINTRWFKIGHQTIDKRNPNVYFRVINKHRDFSSIRHPVVLKGKVGMENLELIKWFPNLNLINEIDIHRMLRKTFPQHYGEFYYLEDENALERMMEIITEYFGGIEEEVNEDEKNIALEYGRNCYLRKGCREGHTVRLLS
jgi:hypothetical protein